MSAEISNALVEIQRMAKQYKAFQEAENALKVLAGYEQNVKELTEQVAMLNGLKAQAGSDLIAAVAELDNTKAKCKKFLADTTAKAEKLIAKNEADIAQRREEADLNLNNTANALAGLEKKYAEVKSSIEEKAKELEALHDEERRVNEFLGTVKFTGRGS